MKNTRPVVNKNNNDSLYILLVYQPHNHTSWMTSFQVHFVYSHKLDHRIGF